MGDDRGVALNILVVDDDDDIRELLCQFLRSRGVNTVEGRNGVEAVNAARLSPPDLIFMDLSMPEMDGIAAARLLRQDERLREVPIIFLTAHGAYGIRLFEGLDGIDSGGKIEYLPKPVHISQLDEILKEYGGL